MLSSCSQEKYKYGERVSIHVLFINIFLAIVKIAAGFFGNSMAMIADGFHSLSDVVTTIAVIITLRISKKPPDGEHPYGHGKVESVVAKIIAIFLILVGVVMLIASVNRVLTGDLRVPLQIALWAALLSILVKEFSYQYTNRAAKLINSTVLAADAWHHRTDALTSVAALMGIAGARMGYPILDPLMASMVSLFVIWAGYRLVREAIDELMDRQMDTAIPKQICDYCSDIDGIEEIRNIKVRKYGMFFIVDMVIVVNPTISVETGHQLALQVKERVTLRFDTIREVFIHVSPNKRDQSTY